MTANESEPREAPAGSVSDRRVFRVGRHVLVLSEELMGSLYPRGQAACRVSVPLPVRLTRGDLPWGPQPDGLSVLPYFQRPRGFYFSYEIVLGGGEVVGGSRLLSVHSPSAQPHSPLYGVRAGGSGTGQVPVVASP